MKIWNMYGFIAPLPLLKILISMLKATALLGFDTLISSVIGSVFTPTERCGTMGLGVSPEPRTLLRISNARMSKS